MSAFFDTNVLVYFIDEDEPEKREIARSLIEEHLVGGVGMISVQVLREFNSVSRRLARPLSDEQAEDMVRYFSTFRTLPEDAGMVLGTARRSRELELSFCDALIVEAALKGGADCLLTRDLQDGRIIEVMRIENPFS